MVEYEAMANDMSINMEKAAIDDSIYSATVELENQITRLGSLIVDLDDKANRHIKVQMELAVKDVSTDSDFGSTEAATRQWKNANDLRTLCNRLESLVYRLDLL